MKKRLLLIGLAFTLVLGACSKDEEKPKEEVKVEKKETDKKQVGITEAQLEQLVLSNDAYIKDKKLQVDVFFENRSDKAIPLAFEKKKAVEVIITDKDGKEVGKKVFVEDERNTLNAKESLSWQYDVDLKDAYGSYKVEVKVNLWDAKEEKVIEGYKENLEVSYESKNSYAYMPKEEKKLVYENNDGSGNNVIEEFLFFKDGYAQAYNTSMGGNVVYYSDDNGYYRVYAEVSDRRINILNDITPRKELLLQLPVKKDATWDVNGVLHKVVDDAATTETKYGSLKDLAVVEVDIGQKVRFYYHKEFGMVKTEVEMADGKYQTMVELKEVK